MKIAIFGATGAVGKETLKILLEKHIDPQSILLFASEKSSGKIININNNSWTLKSIKDVDFSNIQYAFFCVNGDFSKEYAKKANSQGCIVIDNSSAFRYYPEIPLIIPQINFNKAIGHKLIANPNCTTAIAALPLFEAHKLFGLKKIIISTYQSTSGAGQKAMEELLEETQSIINGNQPNNKYFIHPIPFNLIPHIDSFQENGYTKEEMKVVWETRKIFDLPNLPISCTSVRVPILRVHSESITIETEKSCSPEIFRNHLEKTTGIDVIDRPKDFLYPMPLTATGKYNVEVGRIRKNPVFGDFGLDFFVCGDQLLRGASLNAVEIFLKIKDKE